MTAHSYPGFTGYPIEGYWQLAPPDFTPAVEQPWDDPQVAEVARIASLGPRDVWDIFSEFPLGLSTWKRIAKAHRDQWVEFNVELDQLAALATKLGGIDEAEAYLNSVFSS